MKPTGRANKPEQNLSNAIGGALTVSGLDLETKIFSASGRGRTFFLTSLFIELFDPRRGGWGARGRRPRAGFLGRFSAGDQQSRSERRRSPTEAGLARTLTPNFHPELSPKRSGPPVGLGNPAALESNRQLRHRTSRSSERQRPPRTKRWPPQPGVEMVGPIPGGAASCVLFSLERACTALRRVG